jgi:hypothetical protein
MSKWLMDENPYSAPEENSHPFNRRAKRKDGWELLIPVFVFVSLVAMFAYMILTAAR